eukprot:3181990-Pyramimonas_sp.AAC.1
MTSTALPGNFSDEIECGLMFYKREPKIFHAIDHCILYAIGIVIPDKTMTSILNAYHQCWMQFGYAEVLYSDGEGALNNDTAKA